MYAYTDGKRLYRQIAGPPVSDLIELVQLYSEDGLEEAGHLMVTLEERLDSHCEIVIMVMKCMSLCAPWQKVPVLQKHLYDCTRKWSWKKENNICFV